LVVEKLKKMPLVSNVFKKLRQELSNLVTNKNIANMHNSNEVNKLNKKLNSLEY